MLHGPKRCRPLRKARYIHPESNFPRMDGFASWNMVSRSLQRALQKLALHSYNTVSCSGCVMQIISYICRYLHLQMFSIFKILVFRPNSSDITVGFAQLLLEPHKTVLSLKPISPSITTVRDVNFYITHLFKLY